MDTEDTRVTIKEAADLAGVKPRTINRWSAAGHLTVERPNGPYGAATYSRLEVLRVSGRRRKDSPDISS